MVEVSLEQIQCYKFFYTIFKLNSRYHLHSVTELDTIWAKKKKYQFIVKWGKVLADLLQISDSLVYLFLQLPDLINTLKKLVADLIQIYARNSYFHAVVYRNTTSGWVSSGGVFSSVAGQCHRENQPDHALSVWWYDNYLIDHPPLHLLFSLKNCYTVYLKILFLSFQICCYFK